MLSFFLESFERQTFRLQRELEAEKDRSDAVLRAILPQSVLTRLRMGEKRIADAGQQVTVLFADLVGFTLLTQQEPPERIVEMLDHLFSRLDSVAQRFGVEKIKTIGDAYMVAAGVGDAAKVDGQTVVEFAFAAREAVRRMGEDYNIPLKMRFGFAMGPVVSGVIGTARPTFDVWGVTVNLASRLESVAPPDGIVTDAATSLALHSTFACAELGTRDLKGFGPTAVGLG